MKKINEIFYSLQGEGVNAGKPAVFVRFSGCNLKCPFCDTNHQSGTLMSDDDIIASINKYSARFVVLTGGEPSLYADKAFVDRLKKSGWYVAIETNGTNELPSNIDFVTCSPKFEYCTNSELALKKCNELKVVYTGDNNMSLYEYIEADYYSLQPCDTGDDERNKVIRSKAISYILSHPKWRLSLQIHKILGLR